MPTLSKQVHVARKQHDCNGCDGYIWPGDKYTRLFGNGDGEPMHEVKYCSRCMTPEPKVPLSDGYDYIRTHYSVPVEVGQTVECDGVRAKILPADVSHGHYLHALAEGDRHPGLWHPTWETVYYNEDGSIAADYRKAKPVEAERQAV